MKLFFLALCFVTLFLSPARASEVVAATSADFDAVIRQSELTMVKFYAPWCGHCKTLAPEWEKAAAELAGKALLVDVDCTKEEELAKKYEIKGFPTIMFFRNGEFVEVFGKGRKSEDIVAYVLANVGPAVVTPASAEELQSLKDENEVVSVTLTASAESPLSKVVHAIAEKMRSKMKFVVITDPTLLPEQKVETVTVYRKTDNEVEHFTGNPEEEILNEFLLGAMLPFAGEITPLTFNNYAVSLKPNAWVLLKPSDEVSIQLKAELTELGKKTRQHVSILWVDAEKYDGVASHLGIPADAKYPAFAIAKGESHYVLPTSEAATVDSINRFIVEFSEGKIKQSVKSQPVPENETVDGLTTIVATTMDKYISSGKDMLIEFYAPWCGHCKNLALAYSKVAKEFESSDVIVAAMDATENDVDSSMFEVSGFPTIYFLPSGGKPILFSGDRTFLGLYKFINEHSSSKATRPNIEEADVVEEGNDEKTDL